MKSMSKRNRNALIVFVLGLCFCGWLYLSCRPVKFSETKVSNVLEVDGSTFYLTLRGETINEWGGDGPFEADIWMNIERNGTFDQVLVYSNNQTHEDRIRDKVESRYLLRKGDSGSAFNIYHNGKYLGTWSIDGQEYEGHFGIDRE